MKIRNIISLLACTFIFWSEANATALSFTGNFDNDNSRFYTTFDVTSASTVSLTSFGYAGGVNSALNLIADGGFDTQLALFSSSGVLVAGNDDGSSIVSASSGNSWDAFMSLFLGVDSYIAVLTQYNSDYISGDLFTGLWSDANATNFVDDSGSQRSSAYAFDISGAYVANVAASTTNTASVPEPASLVLIGFGLIGLGLARRRQSS